MDEPRHCASCDVKLERAPIVSGESSYCCDGCARGGPCNCTYVDDPARFARNGHGRSADFYGGMSH